MATNFEPHEYVIFVQSTKIGTNENKGIHSKWRVNCLLLELISKLDDQSRALNNVRW